MLPKTGGSSSDLEYRFEALNKLIARLVKIVLYVSIFASTAGLGAYLAIHLLIRDDNRIVVPDLVSKDVVYALEVLSDLGLNTKVKKSEYHPAVPKHHIIDQFPEAGTEIKRGRDVRLMISKGARLLVFPNVAGMDLAMAGIILEENDLIQRKLSYAHSRTHSKGKVLSQSPTAGSNGVRGDALDLLISSGPPLNRIRMMDLQGLPLGDAIETIEKFQLSVGTITQIDNHGLTVDAVVSQSPEVGHPVLQGKSVDLTINRPNQMARNALHQDMALFRHRAVQGFLRQKLRVRINRPDVAMDIYDDFAKPGEEIWLLIIKDAPTALFLYQDDELILTKHYN